MLMCLIESSSGNTPTICCSNKTVQAIKKVYKLLPVGMDGLICVIGCRWFRNLQCIGRSIEMTDVNSWS